MELKKDYFISASKSIGKSIASYYEDSKVNFVLVEKGEIIMWRDGDPVIYGNKDEVLAELANWDSVSNVSIKTERWLIDTYCKDELKKALDKEKFESEDALNFFINPRNGHDEKLVRLINLLWKKNKNAFGVILIALFKRDFNEIINADSFAGLPSDEIDAWFSLSINWETNAYNYLMHIADDGDLETIINFIRDKEYHL